MARTVVATQPVPITGLNGIALTAPTLEGDVVEVGAQNTLLVLNESAGVVTVTVQTPGDVNGLAIQENAVAVAAGAMLAVALDKTTYARANGSVDAGKAYVDYDAVGSVTRAVIAR